MIKSKSKFTPRPRDLKMFYKKMQEKILASKNYQQANTANTAIFFKSCFFFIFAQPIRHKGFSVLFDLIFVKLQYFSILGPTISNVSDHPRFLGEGDFHQFYAAIERSSLVLEATKNGEINAYSSHFTIIYHTTD